MTMTSKGSIGGRVALSLLLLALAGCETTGETAPYEPNASMGMLIARDSCRSCHEISSSRESPNPDATPFREIINRPGMGEGQLATWLRDAHNYPIEMGVHLEPHQVDSLVAYMLRLQSGEPVSED